MPRRADLSRILVIGAGPIVIGQGCEFDYSGTQGLRALRAEGYEVVLVNSNPATIMTDPELADRTYVEPLDVPALRAIVERERPSAILPTLGGQTALNLALALADDGTLAKYGVELLGAKPDVIRKAEDRALFKDAMEKIGLACPRAIVARSIEEARAASKDLGWPLILRPSFTLGGTGGGIARDEADLEVKVARALEASPTHEVLVEESLLGWKEFELEVIRDRADNFIVVCTIENLDPLGVHTGDSITVAPAMTLTDKEYQRLRDAARAVMSEIGVETGGANVQFAVRPGDGEVRVIEMNPRVSRSSALASKATGYPIAKIATKLAIGYSLDELRNDLTGSSAAFEPTLDYVVVKWPRFAFEKFPGADDLLGTQMKSVGEAMSIGRTFCESVQKAARALETGLSGLTKPGNGANGTKLSDQLLDELGRPNDRRLLLVVDAMRAGATDAQVAEATAFDPWFVAQFRRIVDAEATIAREGVDGLTAASLAEYKRLGFGDQRIGELVGKDEKTVREIREKAGVRPTFSRVDTCAAEMPGTTPYMYATWETESETAPGDRKKIVVLGAGPNRIGQGIEFDYCCVHALSAVRELGFEAVMINSNPETVSTDYDMADRLYFEPVTLETVLEVCNAEKPEGVLVQFGGQTPLRLATELAARGIKLLGTSADAIDRAEDRERFDEVLDKLGLERPASAIARTHEEVRTSADRLGFPVLVRPSYVLGGRAMKIARNHAELDAHLSLMAASFVGGGTILVDRFLDDAVEVDVDCISDGKRVVIGGVLEHLERAGVHSGDSATILPPFTLRPEIIERVEEIVRSLALELGVVGLMNAQLAVKDGKVYVLEVNPRASRTVPFVAKAIGLPLVRIATKVMLGKTLDELGIEDRPLPRHVAAKECVFPFKKLPGADTALGPEMRSTGEVMGIGDTPARAYGKALRAIGASLARPSNGAPRNVLLSVTERDRMTAVELGRRFRSLGFDISAVGATAAALTASRIPHTKVEDSDDGRASAALLRSGTIALAVVTAEGDDETVHTRALRQTALASGITCFTTAALAKLGCAAMEEDEATAGAVRSIQEWYAAS
ncbi:Carbamoyl-phosphate synthase large chain [Labilithrix luteola]|uniref:Carbamoyl phosphate synthase large chain n=1 Tax=Labilithrix luteola TaxID=1391654 RepID=A0A0K1Q0M9_9BACT|nr:carbamoyl-phosphate synthase large subunit [Labilithrix luteola]AKU99196.1 Carbamoyl-phosphate synthase large chain [Labilithrix luteola]